MNDKNKTNEIKKLFSKRDEVWKKCFQEYDEYRKLINDKVSEIFDFKGKFLQIQDSLFSDNPIYMLCDDISIGLNGDRLLVTLRGYGFTYNISDYSDFLFANLKGWFTYKIDLSGTPEEIVRQYKEIKIITKEEFNENFNKMLQNLADINKKYIDNEK